MKPEAHSVAKQLEQQLLLHKKTVYVKFAETVRNLLDAYMVSYLQFLNMGKTERECAVNIINQLEAAGFSPFDSNKKYKAGEKLYFDNRKRSVIAAVLGTAPLTDGVRILASHIDSPRLDLKPNPLYEDTGLGYLKTHYYGGIKKYQWAAIPLAIHGVVVKKDGTTIAIEIGEDPTDPVFCVSDILPHLSKHVQDSRTARDVIKGEELNILLGSEPIDDPDIKEPVKLNLMRLLNDKYGIYESDFNSADIELVPAFAARYVGVDKSMVGGYGQDDRVSAFTALTALLETPQPAQTAICVFADKEEIGSVGNTGLSSDMLRNFLTMLARSNDCAVELVYQNSKCLSADVSAAYDPNFAEVMEKRNAAFLNYGPVVTKYHGSGGKYATSEASAEFMAEIRALLDEAQVPWQTGELGKVDEGGGGTVSKFIASLGIEVVDIGVPLLSMHSPFEVASCLDILALYRAFCAFLQ